MKWIRIDQPFILPLFVKDALQRLDEAGHIVYIVGGCVRDFLLNRPIKDWDLATSANPDELCNLFPHAITVGKRFGVIKIPVGEEKNKCLEIATFRKDLDYQDHRHPAGVLLAGPAEDALRRDFSINALFYDPKTQRILDVVEGYENLKKRIIKAIGVPDERFSEDALRLLRAVRFSSVLGFEIESSTLAAIQKKAHLIKKISVERIREELNSILLSSRPALAFQIFVKTNILKHLLPELETLQSVEQPPIYQFKGSVWDYTLKVLDTIAKLDVNRSHLLCWAALLHEVGKPFALKKNQGKNFNGHEIEGALIARTICDRFKMPRSEGLVITKIIEDHLKFKDVFQMRDATLHRWFIESHFENSLALHRATALVSDGNLAFYEFCASKLSEIRKFSKFGSGKLVNGEDLIQLGLEPSPVFSQILSTLEELVLEKKIKTKEEALEYVIKNFVK